MAALPRRPLGNTGIDVSCLGLGTVKLGRSEGVKYPGKFTIPDDQAVLALLAQAQALGINLIDTAPAYGNSEERLGRLMQQRQDWVICSKTGEEFVGGKSTFDFSAGHTRKSVERSLRRLNTDYLDLVLVHSDGNDVGIIEQTDCFETLARCRDQGKIRAFGISGKTVAGGLLAAPLCDVVMVSCNPGYTDELEVIQRAGDLHKGVLIKKAFASGHALASSRHDQAQPTPGRPTDDTVDTVYRTLRFIFAQPGVTSIIAGTINPAHLQHNVDAATRAVAVTVAERHRG
ncbi:MAG: aldo/keto reductase [Gammaproteobacteria bacterium]|nr:aldo/keto reductase [Gammaproteobacteria bacterium]|tara:strand:+ start:767 stop:1630 length:864 start_codon:yes stop_codon:yes gene_type:complete